MMRDRWNWTPLEAYVAKHGPRTITACGLSQSCCGSCRPVNEKEVAIAMEFLRDVKRVRSACSAASSYGLKHSIGRWAGAYISNGAALEAARRLGISILVHKRDTNYPNGLICVSASEVYRKVTAAVECA